MFIPVSPTSRVEDLDGRQSLIAIGNFDGVHQGHQAVLRDAARQAQARGLVPIVLTFDPHPTVAVGRPAPACLTPIERRVQLIEALDPQLRVLVARFDAAFAAQSPEQFVAEVLVNTLHARCVRVGENFRFGAGRAGDFHTLVQLGKRYGFEAQSAPLVGDLEGRYSSSRVRKAIAEGDLELASFILTRPHALSGQVVEGQKRARGLGFPTANLAWVREALPPHGVYAVAVDKLDAQRHGLRLGLGVCNVGVRPTVEAGFAVEAHVFDWQGDLYGQFLRLHLVQFLRPEQKFSSLDQLKAQIAIDSATAKQVLSSRLVGTGAGQAWF